MRNLMKRCKGKGIQALLILPTLASIIVGALTRVTHGKYT